MDIPRRFHARRARAARLALLVLPVVALAVAAPGRARAAAPTCTPAFQEARMVGDFTTPPNSVANSPRLQLLDPCEAIAMVRLTAGDHLVRFVTSTGDTLGGDGSAQAVPGGPYATTGGTGSIRMAVAQDGWYVFRLDVNERRWSAEAKPAVPSLVLRAFPGVPATDGSDSTVSRTVTIRWLRDPVAEALPNFGGYRIWRQDTVPDTTNMDLVRRFAYNDTLLWHFPADQQVLQFVDPDSTGNLVKVCRRVDSLGRCLVPGDSVYKLMVPPGPHDGFPLYYSITLGAIDQTLRETASMFIPDTLDAYARCGTAGNPLTCPNLNGKYRNLLATPVMVTSPAQSNVERVVVVPNPYRGAARWDPPGQSRVQFLNLTGGATVRVYTIAGDLVRELRKDDPLTSQLAWDLKNADGRDVTSGIYLFHVKADQGYEQKGHFVVIR